MGGLTEARRVCELAAERGRLVVPHGWKTGIAVAAAAHLAAVTPHMPYFEFVPAAAGGKSALRRELDARRARARADGTCRSPQRPGSASSSTVRPSSALPTPAGVAPPERLHAAAGAVDRDLRARQEMRAILAQEDGRLGHSSTLPKRPMG